MPDYEGNAFSSTDCDMKKARKKLSALTIKLSALEHEHMFLTDKLKEAEAQLRLTQEDIDLHCWPLDKGLDSLNDDVIFT